MRFLKASQIAEFHGFLLVSESHADIELTWPRRVSFPNAVRRYEIVGAVLPLVIVECMQC